MRNSSVFWGIVLVLLGGLLLAQNMGVLPPNFNVWSIFWPLVLIGLGILGVMRAFRPRRELEQEAVRLPLDGARSAELHFHHGAGELRVDDAAAPDELLSGSFGGGLQHQVTRRGDEAVATLRTPDGVFPGMMTPFDMPQGLNWTVGLNREIPLSLAFEMGASRNVLNLRNLQVRDLRLQTGASSTEIEFPAAAGATRAVIKSGAASVEVRIPANVAARIHAQGGLSSIDVDTVRFPRIGNDYLSPDYNSNENRLDLEIETGVGSVNVR